MATCSAFNSPLTVWKVRQCSGACIIIDEFGKSFFNAKNISVLVNLTKTQTVDHRTPVCVARPSCVLRCPRVCGAALVVCMYGVALATRV